jgi:cholesterol oxidase
MSDCAYPAPAATRRSRKVGTSGRTGPPHSYDVVVIGSGFGGSVTALRLTEKGYHVAVLESGARFADHEFAETSWQLKRFLFAPRLGCYGIQRISLLDDVMVLAGAGVGGGSLVYANTLYEPLDDFFQDHQWRGITDWKAELAPFYDQASRMLGVNVNPTMTPSDVVMRKVADDLGVGDTFRLTPVGVFFGDDDTPPGTQVDDPYFGGAGPARRSCIQCGECMTGCRHNAKNTLTKNYLYLAEQLGAVVHPLTTARTVRPLARGGYAVDTTRTGARPGRGRQTFTAAHVVFAAGALGTQRLLHQMRDDHVLPRLSPMIGELTRTNSESIVGAVTLKRDIDYSQGVAISSSFHPDAHTHVEPVRYGKGSNAMGMLQTLLTDGGERRWLRWMSEVARHPYHFAQSFNLRHWSERTIIALVMQSLDNSLTVSLRGGRLTSRQGHGDPNPAWIPAANDVVRRLAEIIDGVPGGTIGEIVNVPLTAHIIGGSVIGATSEDGVVDAYHRVYGHPGLHVVDGSAISANLGVNPSLTITAQAERAMAFWPNKGEADQRPPLGAAYRPVKAVGPWRPAVPLGAPGELKLP